jgi:hypothetical protein
LWNGSEALKRFTGQPQKDIAIDTIILPACAGPVVTGWMACDETQIEFKIAALLKDPHRESLPTVARKEPRTVIVRFRSKGHLFGVL